MKATVDGVTYEGSEDEIRRIAENPPRTRSAPRSVNRPGDDGWPTDEWAVPNPHRNWDGSPRVTC